VRIRRRKFRSGSLELTIQAANFHQDEINMLDTAKLPKLIHKLGFLSFSTDCWLRGFRESRESLGFFQSPNETGRWLPSDPS
jgi:hypothetical protein